MTSPAILEHAAYEVRRALRAEGRSPQWHRSLMARHRAEWPVLWAALDSLVAAIDEVERDEHSSLSGTISDGYGDEQRLAERMLASGAFDVEPDESLRCGAPVAGFSCTRSIGHAPPCWATGTTTIGDDT